ncbi:DUF4270 domain-containing protein [Flavobacterium sp.]|uniref:DUF4270 domain-containing protein n=1 Tax=Flavobacterium sp. TaxID=239 RepID=UPI00261EF260|nr:DUF4270 domain-containing protein [Flavobacterium sp.]MDG2430881.1 DUF4270 domain-containing protein [Flavobacterium sp.]
MYTKFFKTILLVATGLFLNSCDKDYNSIGGDLIGGNNFDLSKYTSQVVAYNQKIGPIESSNLPVNALGVYSNGPFGTTTANFATQVTLEAVKPTIGVNPVIESVVLTIPYFSTLKSTEASTGNNTYTLDSIYGGGKIKLSVYESGFAMQRLDPNNSFQAQKYYTDQNSIFDANKIGNRLNDDMDPAQNEAFFFSPEEYRETKIVDTKETVTRTAPGMRLNLNKTFFKTNIIDAAASGNLATNDVFRNYFRGLYFKVEKISGVESQMAMLNFAAGKITINYKEDSTDPVKAGDPIVRLDKSIVINLTGTTVNLLNDTDSASYSNVFASSNATTGDAKLHLKGGEGSLAVIELFSKTDVRGFDSNGNPTNVPNGVSDELDDLRYPADGKKLLINEANLVFHIDAAAMAGAKEPNRVYLYDLTHSQSILDYKVDGTSGTKAQNGKFIYSGFIKKEAVTDGRGQTYKVRLTNQIRNLIKNADSTNVKLGLVVTGDINNSTSASLRTAKPLFSKAPRASVITPLGTVLYGNNVADEAKKLKLEIYYTKSNN